MDHSDAVQYLRQYQKIILEIHDLEENRKNISTRLYGFDGMRRTSIREDQKSDQGAKLTDIDSEITRLLDTLYRKRIEIERMIDNLSGDERRIIRLRYIACRPDGRGYNWWDVSELAHFSRAQCIRIHNAAVRKMRPYDTI